MKKGFTLIELLVVIAIIGILSGVIFTGAAQSRAKARDARRISDINQIRIALEAYYEASGQFDQQYPNELSDLVSANVKYLPAVPRDPSGQSYGYSAVTTGGKRKGYCLGANLETAHAARGGNAGCTITDFIEGPLIYKVGR